MKDKQKEAHRERCERCDKLFPAEEMCYGPDPYAHEIDNDDTPEWQCQECNESSAGSI